MPQTIFYSINNDVLSPLCFGLVFVCLLKWPSSDVPSPRLATATGLALAATFLAKTTNLPLLTLAAVFIAVRIRNLIKGGKIRASLWPPVCLFLCAALPIASWVAWCKVHFGSFLGSAATAQILGWTPKPFSQWWNHPIFTPRGFGIFLFGNLATFWQGEMMWHGKPLYTPIGNLFYEWGTIILVVRGVVHLNKAAPSQRFALWFALASILMMFALVGFLSIIYDFRDCVYPSRAHPYFTSGRLMLGMLIPFLLVMVYGLDRILGRFGNATKFVTLAVLLLSILALELATNWPVFSSQYNWFHIGTGTDV
ncbi:MAG TPA: hypothetical protein VMF08_13065 [Candidatus Sulfotelmatobacter sp.]|nr:hypothetical protein [Candidatus Sulfotelmatobacter sp.]